MTGETAHMCKIGAAIQITRPPAENSKPKVNRRTGRMNGLTCIKSWKTAIRFAGIFCLIIQLPAAALSVDIQEDFADPPIEYWARPLWFWNNTEVKVEVLDEQMRKSKELCKYGGFGILPFGKSFGPEYLGEQYFAVYGAVLAKARELGMTMSLYDDYGFPSVPAGTWKIMVFTCVRDGYPSCDYLDPLAVEKFVEITHQAYHDRFREHFGTTIDSTFHDEPTLNRRHTDFQSESAVCRSL